MTQKLLFFDIDGTLLTGDMRGYIPDSAIEGIQQAQKNGHLVFINTGRTYGFTPDIVRDFPFDGYICGCGTHIILHDKTLYHNQIPQEIQRRMEDIFCEAKVQGVLEGTEHCYFSPDDTSMFPVIRQIRSLYGQLGLKNPVLTFDDPDISFDKFVIVSDEYSDIALFQERIHGQFEYIQRENMGEYGFAEIIPAGHSKGTGIDHLVDTLNLSLSDCYVFGDSTNDLPMLQHVKHSIAMGNSFPEVLHQTEYVTARADRDGIWLALRHYGLI